METLYDLWGKRNPQWEIKYQESVIEFFSDYGKGVNQYQDIRGKIFGAGYEVFILAFFIGLYHNQTKPLVDDKTKRKVFGQPICHWGDIENRDGRDSNEKKIGRSSYGRIREYIFAALIAKTDIDFIALDKGDISSRDVVNQLMNKMEQYANFGFNFIREKLDNNPNYFFNETAFLRTFLSFLKESDDKAGDSMSEILPEEL